MNYRESNHFRYRAKQRSISNSVVNHLTIYGKSKSVRGGCEMLYFDRDSLDELYADMPQSKKMLDKHKNAYIIVSKDGCLITAARAH